MHPPTVLYFLTGNRFKFEVTQQALLDTGLVLEQKRLAVPEIQSNSVQEIAEYSAQCASQQFDKPFIVQDAGFYIDALNGFPGPFIKYMNQWFNTDDLLRLMHGRPYRRMTVQDCLVYVTPGQPLVSFSGTYQGTLATSPGPSTGTPIERLFIPHGYETPISEFSTEAQVSYWSSGQIWQAFKSHYQASKEESRDLTQRRGAAER